MEASVERFIIVPCLKIQMQFIICLIEILLKIEKSELVRETLSIDDEANVIPNHLDLYYWWFTAVSVASDLPKIQSHMCVLFNLAETYNKVSNTNMMKKPNENQEIESAKRMEWISKRRKGAWNTVCGENLDITLDRRSKFKISLLYNDTLITLFNYFDILCMGRLIE